MLKVKIKKSSVPIVWLDTSVIFKMTFLRKNIGKMNLTDQKTIGTLYDKVSKASASGSIICPLAGQDYEIWASRKECLKTLHEINFGIECALGTEIIKKQFIRAMKSYINEEKVLTFSYEDAFYRNPISELEDISKSPYYISATNDIPLGADYYKANNNHIVSKLNEIRERNVIRKFSFQNQLDKEYGHELDHYDLNLIWDILSIENNTQKSFESFFLSDHYKLIPFASISSNLYAKKMTDPQSIKNGDVKDIEHISTFIPYADLFITDHAWSDFLNKKKLSQKYNCKICYSGNTQEIEHFFNKLSIN